VRRFIIKRRSVGLGQPNPFRGGKRQVTFGPWQTVSIHPSLEVAEQTMRGYTAGLYDRAIFYKGKIVATTQGRVPNYERLLQ
jgi:hypothetical protein